VAAVSKPSPGPVPRTLHVMPPSHVFTGRIAGHGTTSGVRLVVGMWATSPFGCFADVMLEEPNSHRTLLAPTAEIAHFISTTYTFDEVQVVPVADRRTAHGISLSVPNLNLTVGVGGISPLGRLLRIVPPAFATNTSWLRAIDPIARVLVLGVRTAGSAGAGRREFYGVTRARTITDAAATWHDRDLGSLAPLWPPVRFGFSSAPPSPQVVDVTTTIVG